MFRTFVRSSLSCKPAVRRLSTARPGRNPTAIRKYATGVALASTIMFLSVGTISNDAQQAKVAKDKQAAEKKPHTQTSTSQEEAEDGKPAPDQGGPTEGEEQSADAEQGAAFNPETGEINWDCPCLGGMAHGPCGEEFKAAFACFVYSETEPKGIDCIQKFETMRTCFRQHPEHYKEELYDGENEDAEDSEVAVHSGETVEPVASDSETTLDDVINSGATATEDISKAA